MSFRPRSFRLPYRPTNLCIGKFLCFRPYTSVMSSTPQPGPGEPATKKGKGAKDKGAKDKSAKGEEMPPVEKKELKILLLHGYAQSGPIFRTKTGGLRKLLTKGLSVPPCNRDPVTLIFPTGPYRLRPSDIPGYQPPEGQDAAAGGEEAETDLYGWLRRDDATGSYIGVDQSMLRIAEAVAEAGGVDGVLAFSQGGAVAAMMAAALEPERAVPDSYPAPSPSTPAAASWPHALRAANNNRPLKFVAVYSGYQASEEDLQWMFKGGIPTPSVHFMGSLDTLVVESRSRELVDRCEEAGTGRVKAVVHPGGHYVPMGKEWVGVLVGFLKDVLSEKPVEAEADETATKASE